MPLASFGPGRPAYRPLINISIYTDREQARPDQCGMCCCQTHNSVTSLPWTGNPTVKLPSRQVQTLSVELAVVHEAPQTRQRLLRDRNGHLIHLYGSGCCFVWKATSNRSIDRRLETEKQLNRSVGRNQTSHATQSRLKKLHRLAKLS